TEPQFRGSGNVVSVATPPSSYVNSVGVSRSFSAPTELIRDVEERFGPELLVCVVARLLFRSPVVDAALFPAFVTSFDLRFSNGGETSLSPGRRRRHRRTECLRGDR